MKIFLTVVALLFLAVQIHAQTKPVAYSPLSRTITISSNTFLLNQRLPACSEVYYRVTDLSSVQQGDLFTVLYVPITDANTPAPSSTVTVELLSGSISSNVALPVSSVISDVINGTTYLSTSSCSFTDTVVERSSGNAGSGCGINYYCSGIDSSITGLVIRIATTGNENTEGILFNLSIRRTRLTIGSLTLSTPLTVTSTVSSGVNYFKPTMYQKHYKVYVGPAGSSITNYADFLTLYNPMTELVFSLSNLKVNGITPTSSQGLWSLNVYLDDIAQADASFMLGTDPSEPCVLYQDVDSAFYSVNTELLITVDSCLIQTGNYFISVGMPNDLSSSFTFDLLVDITDKDAVEDYIPTYQTLTSGTPINDIIGDYALSEALEQNVYLINLAKSAYKAGQYFFVTVYGVDLGSIEFEVTQGCYGFNSGCSACSVIAECNAVTRSKDTGLDYCKVKVDPCTLNVNDATPYFVTVRGTGINSRFVTYSILYELMSTTPVDITTFKTTTGSNYVEYTYSGSVAEQDYNHFSLTITASSISEFHLLSAHLYVNQEQNEVIFSHNVDSLAGSAEFDTNYNGTDYTVYGPYDSCYDYDYSCNTYLKFGYDYNDSDQIGSCNLQIPYCEILSGSTHYFSVYALNISPNSDYNLNNFPTYPDGLGYARSVDYTFVVRLWNSAQPLTLNQVINEHVLPPSTLDYYSSNLVDSQYSHQYVFELPTVSSGSYIDTVRVRVDDVTGSSDIVVFVGCGSPAGPCPCYKYDYSCTVGPNDEYRFCQVGIPVCACEGPYYVSIYPLDATASPAATYFTITVYADIAQSLQTVVPSATTTKISTRLLPNNNNFDDIPQNSAYYGYTVVGGTTVVYYAGDLYTISVPSTPSSSSSLQIKLRYSHIPGKSYFDSTRMVMALGNNESVPPANPALANCSQNCVVQPGYSYCSITLNPCEYTAGNHFVRIYGVGYTTYIAPDELDMTDFFGMEYTLEVVEVSNTPMSVTLGTPFRDTITQSKYNHYQVSIPSSTTSSALRFSIYRNSNQNGELGLFYNPSTLAGYEPCYTADRHCFLENDIASMCEVILAPCDVASLSGTTVYFSVATPPDQREILEYPYYYGIVEGDKNLEYTVLAQLVGVTTLDLTKGNPLTANLLYRHEAYYSFTISSTDISAGKIFNLQVQSLETEPNYDSVDTLKITISQNAPGSSVAGDCPCGDIVFTNTFRTQTFPCDLLGNAGTYYVNVRALDYGLPNVLDPVSYTIRAWYTTPISQTLSLSSSWTVAPHPLDFEEIVAYKISYTPRADTILVVEIADITNTRDSSLASGLNAYLSVNYPSAVLTPAYDSLFVGSDSGCNYFDSCDPSNELSEELAAGTVMCNFVVTPCIQCSSVSTYYVTIVPELLQPEPLVQFRLNYTIRAYTKTITTLNNYPSNARTNALASGGYSFSLQETVNPNITCENRFTTNPFFNDFYFKLSSITVNQYEILEYSNDVSNPSNILYTFNDGVAPDYIFNDCGCDSLSGQACTYTSGCSLGSQSITTYGVVGYVEGCPSGPLSSNANGLSFTTEILNQYDYTQLSSVSATINRVYNGTLTEGQFIIYSISVSSVNFNLLPTGGFDFTFSNGDVNSRTCVSFSDPLTSGSGVVFPGSASSSSSYCSLCSPAPTTDFLGCCVDPTSVYYITIYNPFGSGQSMTYTFEAFVDYAATSFTQLSALPISTSVTSVSPTLPALFSFDITAANMNEDDVVNMRFTSTNGTATVYFNNLYFAHPDNLCADFYYQCSTNNADDCVIQVPYCYFVSVANTGSTYQSYYLAIISAESGNFVGPVSINIAVQRTTSFSIPTTTALTNTIPDASFVPVGYLQHYKFKFTRSVGDQLLNDNDVALTIQLNPGTSANNTLQISIHDPRLSTTSTNVLAGDLTSSFATGSCSYNTDSNWLCYRVSTGITGATTRTTDGATDGVVCYLYFCDNGDMEATVNQLLANEYIYVSVQNLATSGRVPTSYSINASVTSIPLASSETTYKLVPAHTSTDVIYNTTCTTGTSSTTGGCFFAASSTITTAYFSIDLSGVGSWAINDYLLVNITNLVGNNIVITSWSSDECEPSSATSDLTCTSGNDCVLDSDPCRFGALYRSDNGANSYKVIPRNGYLRISGITTGTTFNIAVLQVSPLQITTTLTASSPSYTNTFQMWDYRWALFNFVVPKDEQHHLQITIDSDCTNGANVPEVYLNEYTYQWASKECSEHSDNTPFTWTHYSCDPAGNVFVSVYTPASTLKYDPIAIAEGSYSPQVKFTITATLVSVVTVNDYSWECDLAFAEAATYNVLALGDNENYGTGLSISLVNPNADASIKIITPLWREQVNYTTGFVDGDFLNSFYYTEDACASPSCTDVGVYCCSDDTDCIINIPPCEYRNGRYFMVVDVPTTAVLSSTIYRQDYNIIQVGNTPVSLSGSLPIGLISGTNMDLHYYQYYKLELVGQPQLLYVDAHLSFQTYAAWFLDTYKSFINSDLTFSNLPTLTVSLVRGENAWIGEGCDVLSCSDTLPGCGIVETQCVSDVYYLAVWYERNDANYNCNSLPFEITIYTQFSEITTIEPNTVICGTIENYDIFEYYFGGSTTLKRDLFDYSVPYVRDNLDYPFINTYYLDTTSVSDFSDITVRLEVFPVFKGQDLLLTVSTSEIPSYACSDCSYTTDVTNGVTVIEFSIGCGNFTDLWISVESTLSEGRFETDYTLEVMVNEYTIYTPTIPTLTSGIPSTVSVTVSDSDSIINFSSNNGARALVRSSEIVYSADTTNTGCSGGCTVAESGCTFLASLNNYYVYESSSFSAATYCFQTGVTTASVSLEVQSVNSLTISSSSVVSFSASVYGSNYQLIIATLPSPLAAASSYMFSFSDSPDGSVFNAYVGCTGFTIGTSCVNSQVFTFSSDAPATVSSSSLCGCSELYIAVSAATCGNNANDFTITVDPTSDATVATSTSLTAAVWTADTIATFANSDLYNFYTVQASSSGFVHVAVANVNNTAGPNFHSVNVDLYTSSGCLLDSCVTGSFAHMSIPARDGNDADESCYVYSTVGANELVYVQITPNEAAASFPAAGITYRIKPTIVYTDLETTSSQNFQIRGYDRHYYKVNGRASGSAANDIQSVVIDLQIIDGDRLNIYVADSTAFADNSNYAGWTRVKTCYFGLCTVEIPTRAQHPGANVFYVWVETVSTNTVNDERLEKPTNYKISATTGTNNCKSGSNLVSGFCSSIVSTLSSVYNYRDLTARNNEAECRYENLLCGCTHSLATCQTNLKRFSCLESFRECDASGFWTPICRSECHNVETSCGTFAAQFDQCDDCSRPEFNCLSPRYADDGSCSGVSSPSASPTPSITPSTSFTSSPTPSISITPTVSPSPVFGNPDSASPSPSPATGGNNIIIIVEESSSSTLLVNTFLVVLAFLFFNF